MCPPDFYGIHYEINPWMNTARQADHAVAVEQWHALHELLLSIGVNVSLLEPVDGLPDLVFTANAAMIHDRQALISRFRHPQRQGEEPHFRRWFAEHGFEVVDVPEQFSTALRSSSLRSTSFEGAGDALFCGDTLYAGYRIRSDAAGHQQIGRLLGVRVIPLELVDTRYYHLDTCFCPLAADEAIWHPSAFDQYGQRAIQEHIPKLITVRDDEARSFACNAVVVGRTVITNAGCDRLHKDLGARGYKPVATPLGEYVKAGGSAKCLTLRLDGEEAAAWRAQ
jgi:N-dimethylarginine dimethylaminohydrolase